MRETTNEGKLYICPTPIGNLSDITFRVVDCLKNVDLIACEDTRRTQKLLNHLQTNNNLESYHKFNQEYKGRMLLDKMLEGMEIALVSDAGTPSISDPGKFLVQDAIVNGIKVISLPGPSAAITALAGSGLETDTFLFLGYLPEKGKDRKEMLIKIMTSPDTVIVYENFRRLHKTLADIQEQLGERQVVIAKELTKVHERYLKGTAKKLLDEMEDYNLQGECTLLIAGKQQGGESVSEEEIWPNSIKDHLREVMSQGLTKKQAIKLVSELREIPKREVYQEALTLQKK